MLRFRTAYGLTRYGNRSGGRSIRFRPGSPTSSMTGRPASRSAHHEGIPVTSDAIAMKSWRR